MTDQLPASKQLREVYNKERRKNDRMLVAASAGLLAILAAMLVRATSLSFAARISGMIALGFITLALVLSVLYLLLLETWLRHTSQAYAHQEGAQHISKEANRSSMDAADRAFEKAPKQRTLNVLRAAGFWAAAASLVSLGVFAGFILFQGSGATPNG